MNEVERVKILELEAAIQQSKNENNNLINNQLDKYHPTDSRLRETKESLEHKLNYFEGLNKFTKDYPSFIAYTCELENEVKLLRDAMQKSKFEFDVRIRLIESTLEKQGITPKLDDFPTIEELVSAAVPHVQRLVSVDPDSIKLED